jgi:mannose-6-phosphate isomerase class I
VDATSQRLSDEAATPPRGVRIVNVDADLPLLEIAVGVSAKHLVCSKFMVRFVEVKDATLDIRAEQASEHLLLVLEGEMQLNSAGELGPVHAGEVVVISGSNANYTASSGGLSRCLIIDDHGFD